MNSSKLIVPSIPLKHRVRGIGYFVVLILVVIYGQRSFAKEELILFSSILTAEDYNDNNRADRTEFTHGEKVFHTMTFTWKNLEKPGGKHKFAIRWFSNGKQLSNNKAKLNFPRSPWIIYNHINASALGYGNHKVEVYVDGKLADSKHFQIVKESCPIEMNEIEHSLKFKKTEET